MTEHARVLSQIISLSASWAFNLQEKSALYISESQTIPCPLHHETTINHRSHWKLIRLTEHTYIKIPYFPNTPTSVHPHALQLSSQSLRC